MPKKDQAERTFAIRVGREVIPQSAEEVELQKGGARLVTSGPVRHVTVTAEVDGNTYEGFGDDWAAAEADLEAQLPKGA